MFLKRFMDLAQDGAAVADWLVSPPWLARRPGATRSPRAAAPGRAADPKPQSAPTLLVDEGFAWSAGAPVTITVRARGMLAQPVIVHVSSSGGGSFSKTRLQIPAGMDGSDSFSFTPEPDRVTTLHYRCSNHPVPPPRKIFSLADPVEHAAVSLQDAAQALLARYRASHWNMGDGLSDPQQRTPARPGQALRAVPDTGYGASSGQSMEMLNWVDTGAEGVRAPVLHLHRGRRCSDHSAPRTWGFWCKRSAPKPGQQPPPRNGAPFNLQDPHFVLMALAVTGERHDGVAFQASKAEENHAAELLLSGNRPQARWTDAAGRQVLLSGPAPLQPGEAAVLGLVSRQGRQSLRVGGHEVDTASARFEASSFAQLLIGWGFRRYFPDTGFGGQVFGVIAGKGSPSPEEIAVLERFLGEGAGVGP